MTNERTFTDAQSAAIDYRGKNLILSAAAGSGKTDTLTERMIRLIGEGAELSRMLCVTFTNAAADELKERIGAALEQMILENPTDRHAARCLASLDCAKISTIHSFFKSEITPYISKFGLPPEFRIMDEAEGLILKNEAMSETVNRFFDEPTDEYEYLCECISGVKDETGLDSALLSVRDTLISYGIHTEDLRLENAENDCDVLSLPVFLPLKKLLRDAGEYYTVMFSGFYKELHEADGKKADLEALRLAQLSEKMISMSDDVFDSAKAFFEVAADSFDRLSATKAESACDCYETFKNTRTDFKKLISAILDRYFRSDSEETMRISEKYAVVIGKLTEIIDSFEKNFSEKKRIRGCVDYNDLETIAEELFCNPDGSPTDAATEVGSKYDYILIDEYQDTSLRQDKVFSAISAVCGRFMVGDVKQSIYSFRGARPELFTRYRECYEKGDGGDAIFLSDNFRSDSCIIDYSNLVSDYIFTGGGTPFKKEDRLICSKPGGKDAPSPCTVAVIGRAFDEDGHVTDDNYEPEYVAEKISEMLMSGEISSPSDVAILLRGSKKASAFADALEARGISANNSAADNFFSYGEVLLVLCLLNTVDNPMRDIYLAGALKSHVFGFTLEELVKIRGFDRNPLWFSLRKFGEGEGELAEKCRITVDTVNVWRKKATELDALEILRTILSDTRLIRYGGDGKRSPDSVAASIKKLMKGAADVAKNGGNLHDLTVYFEMLISRKDSTPFEKDSESVSILTIHKSKGLGFPVCFLCDTGTAFTKKDIQKPVIITPSGQITTYLTDEDGLVKCKTPQYMASCREITVSSVEEEARVLYVALTRAKKKLYVTMSEEDPEKLLDKAREAAKYPYSAYSVSSAGSFKEWIIDCAVRNTPSPCFNLEIIKPEDIEFTAYSPAKAVGKSTASEEFFKNSESGGDGLEHLRNIPAKLTVSALKPDILNSAVEESATIDRTVSVFMPEEAPVPRFMQETEKRSAADAGTATHIFMQFCDFENLKKYGAEEELKRLIEKKFISKKDAGIVYTSELELFRQSDIFEKMRTATKIMREKRFNSRLPAEEFTTDPELSEKLSRDGIKITVQGVVDCIFKTDDGKWVLIDYKTDRLTKEELSDRSLAEEKLRGRHSRQLNVYREVCERLLGEKIDRVLIYSLPLGDTIDIIKES